MSHHDTQSKLTSLPMLTIRQWCLFLYDIYILGGYAWGMLCAPLLPTNSTAAEPFKSLSDSMSGKLNWSFCISICTNRRAAMIGWFSDFTTQIKEIASECEFTHCITHREILRSQICHLNLEMFCRMWFKMSTILRCMPLTHMCLYSPAELTCLLLYTAVRWLSKERSLARVFVLWESHQRFLLEKWSTLEHISVTQNGLQNLLTYETYSADSMNSVCHFRWEQLCSHWLIKWLHSRSNWNYGGDEWMLGFGGQFKH